MTRTRLAGWALALVLVAAFVALGRWQWRRADVKEARLAAQATVLAERRPESLSTLSLHDESDLAWAAGRGEFVRGPVLLLDNQRRGDAVGVREFRVFRPDGGRALLVDLGWRPLPPDRTLPPVETLPERVDLRGLLAPPPSAGLALGADHAEPRAGTWLLTRVDVPALSQALAVELAPRVLRLDPAEPLGYARDLEALPNTLPPERHRGYAVQWFALAFATVVTAVFLELRRRP
jgi:cytochrome oxidase assembly protein ShyY1